MDFMDYGHFLLSTLFLLAIVSICVAISKKLGLGSILGLLLAGVIVGPHSPGPKITDEVETLMHFAELGVVLLLFLIGLEMKPKKLWSMRREVFGLGSSQIILSGVFLAAYVHFFIHKEWNISLLLGLTLALSSTAFVMQILQERGEIASRYGSTSFAILLMQDLAIVPLLAMVPLLSNNGALGGDTPLYQQAIFVTIMLAVVIGFGRIIVPYTLDKLASEGNREAFTFLVMFSVVLAAWAMESAGLSMALGAFLMGMTLSDSKYHFQIEAHIEPFKGVLMSLFFVAVGMSIDIGMIADKPLLIAQHVFVIMLVKIVSIFMLAMIFGNTKSDSIRISFLLSQSGEFGFVLFGAAKVLGVIDSSLFIIGLSVISISMLLTPFYVKVGDFFTNKNIKSNTESFEIPSIEEHKGVVIAGFGRVGYTVADMLKGSGINFIAYDTDVQTVKRAREQGLPVYYGDMSSYDFISAIHIENAKLVVITVDNPLSTLRIVSHIKTIYPKVKIFARARDIKSKDVLISHGVTWALPEAIEGSLRMGAEILVEMGINKDNVEYLLTALRKDDYKNVQTICALDSEVKS